MWHFSWNLHGLNWWKVGFTSHLARQRTCHRVVPVEFRRVSPPSVLASARPRRYRHFVDELHLFFLQGSRIWRISFCLLTWSTLLLDVQILFHCTFILMILTFTASSTRLFTCDFSCPGEMLSLRRHLEDFGLLYLHWVHGWLDTCVRNSLTGSLLDLVLRFFPTAECRNCVSSTCCAIFGTLTIFSTRSNSEFAFVLSFCCGPKELDRLLAD